jgi:hypothetical protein
MVRCLAVPRERAHQRDDLPREGHREGYEGQAFRERGVTCGTN